MFMGLPWTRPGSRRATPRRCSSPRTFYGGLFDSLKYADALTLNLDVAEKGLHLAGFLKVKPDSDAAKSIAEVAHRRDRPRSATSRRARWLICT